MVVAKAASPAPSEVPGSLERVPRRAKWTLRTLRPSRDVVLGAVAVLAFVGLWQLAVDSGWVSRNFVASPTAVAGALRNMFGSGSVWPDLRVSAEEVVIGLAIALAIAIPGGVAYGTFRTFRSLAQPFVLALNAMPQIALVPVLILAFGVGINSKVVIVVLATITPVWLNTESGVRTVDSKLVRLADSFGAGYFQTFAKISLPHSVPSIVGGVRLAIGRALVAMVVGELFASVRGIGHILTTASTDFNMPVAYAALVIVTAGGLVLSGLLRRVEKHFDAWRD